MNELMSKKAIIDSTNIIRLELDAATNKAITDDKLKKILHDECKMIYGKLRSVPKLGNTNRSLYLR